MTNTRTGGEKVCERCHRPFSCQSDPTCWCFQTELSPQALQKLQTTFKDCLCPECLTAWSKEI